jgi:WD40 repeat protein
MVSWSPNGQLFLTASDDKTIKAWDAATNKVVKTLDDKAKPNSDRVISAVFSKDGQFVVATLADNTVNVYSYNNGNVVAQVKGDLAVPAAISGDQTLVAYAGSRTIRTFDLKKNAAGPEFPYFDPTVKDLAPVVLAFSPDNSTLAVGLSNGRIILYATASGKSVMELEPLPDTKSGIKQLAWFGNGAGQLAVGREASVETLAIDLSKKVATNALTPQSLDAPTSSLNVSADGKRLAVSTQKGDLQLWSLENNSILTRSSIGTNPVIGLHWSQDDQKITIATGGGSPALNTVAAQQTARSTTITLTPQNGTKVTGTALLTEIPGGSVRVTLNVEGLDPGQHNVHIHAGTCANQGDIKFDLETLRPTADGKATSTTVIKTDFTSLITGSFYINVHNDPGTPTYIASCGEIHV